MVVRRRAIFDPGHIKLLHLMSWENRTAVVVGKVTRCGHVTCFPVVYELLVLKWGSDHRSTWWSFDMIVGIGSGR